VQAKNWLKTLSPAILDEIANARDQLDRRYDDLESGKVKLVDGEGFFEGLRRREEELSKKSQQQ